MVNFEGDPRLIGEFVAVTITQAMPNSLRGEIVPLAADTETGAEKAAHYA